MCNNIPDKTVVMLSLTLGSAVYIYSRWLTHRKTKAVQEAIDKFQEILDAVQSEIAQDEPTVTDKTVARLVPMRVENYKSDILCQN